MRKNCDAATVKMWADEKKSQMNAEKSRHAQEEADYAAQTDAITRFRGLTEDENTKKRLDANKALQIENQKLAQQKRDRETAWAQGQQAMNLKEITVHKDMDATHTKQYLSHAI